MISDGSVKTADVIEYEGNIWLVQEWQVHKSEGWKTPLRIVSIGHLQMQRMSASDPFGDFVVNEPLEAFVLDLHGQPPEGSQYKVIDSPGFRVPLLKHHH